MGTFPAIFYAVGTNNQDIVRTWVKYGGNVNAVESRTGLLLLVFVIINAGIIEADTTPAVLSLLSLGADVSVLSRSLYILVLQDSSQPSPPAPGPDAAEPPEFNNEYNR